ncbi:MAG: acyltransferase [Rhodoglobus sp.]
MEGSELLVEAKPGQLRSIQVARGVAALSVLAFHSLDSAHKYFGGIQVLPAFFDGGKWGVDLFFVISGFVMVLTTRKRHGEIREAGKFLWSRFFRIYPTYWFYCLLLLPVYFLAPGLINSSQGNHVDLLASFLLLPSDTLPLVLVAWTLTIELWFYLVFAVLLLVPERFLPLGLGIWFAVLIAINWNGPIDASPFIQVPTNSLAIEFIFGAVAALLFRQVGRVLACVLAAAGVAVIVFLSTAIAAGPALVRPLTLGVGFALVVLAFAAFENRSGIGVVGRLSIFGDISYSVYLSHIMVLAVMGQIWQRVPGPLGSSVPAIAVWWVVTFAAALVVGYLSYRWVEKPVTRLAATWRDRVFRAKPTTASAP